MLPKPRNASLKETNRILLPHTLTKKKPPSKTTQSQAALGGSFKSASIKSKPAGAGPGLATSCGSDEDEEDNSGTASFFSFGESSQKAPEVDATVTKPQTANLSKPSPELSTFTPGPVVSTPASQPAPRPVLTSKETEQPDRPPQPHGDAPLNFGPSASQDSPLVFKPSNTLSGQDAPLAFSKPMNPSMQYGYSHTSPYTESQTYTAPFEYTEYNQPYQENPQAYGEGPGADSMGEQSAGGSTDLAADKEFQRLMGKRNVGKEAINMIEIAADEQIGPMDHLDWMKKNLTEEKEYRAKLRKDQLPSGQQRRKHQITYLAHQAKERELELKNQWANNRQTRKQTQMKYGF